MLALALLLEPRSPSEVNNPPAYVCVHTRDAQTHTHLPTYTSRDLAPPSVSHYRDTPRQGPWFIADTPWPDLHWDMNLEETYYFPMEANRPDLSSTLTAYMRDLLLSGNLATNVPEAWRFDSAAAPTGARWEGRPMHPAGPVAFVRDLLCGAFEY